MKRKILMVTMGLAIGGAETHIVELSRALAERGWDVIIASNGGVFVPAVEAAGIRHVSMPLHDRNPAHMAISYRLLKKLIREEKPDIVHAHARIPAFITGLVRRSVKFRFVTTAHGVFQVTSLNRRLTDWGDRTVAVSNDIRDYLVREYGVAPERIHDTINGIDTGLFSPATSGEAVAEEFHLEPGAPVIVHVSRLDEASTYVTRQLLAAAPALAARKDGARILIAGSGGVFDGLREEADRINARLGRDCVIMAGARTDIRHIVAAGDIFVGVSRAALEAMSTARPVLLAGSEGYIGPLSEDRFALGQSTNFCGRGCGLSTPRQLQEDLLAMLNMPEEERAAWGRAGRELVLKQYSVDRMVDDYCAVYDLVLQKPVRILMSGYFGFRNPGDEAILTSTYGNIRSLGGNVRVQALVYKPERSAGQYDFEMVDRFRPVKVLRAVRGCDVLISGGGSLLQDRTSRKSIWYYLAIIRLAEIMGKKVALYANGIGPVQFALNRRLVRRAVQGASLITLRDENSARELEEMGVTGVEMHVTADPVFTYDRHLLESLSPEDPAEEDAEEIPTDVPFAGISVRSWQTASPDFPERAAALCDYIHDRYGLRILFVVMQNPEDLAASRAIRDAMKAPARILEKRYSTAALMKIMGSAKLMLCMRLHALIFAAYMGVPSLGIIYDPKVRDYLELLDMPSLGAVEDLDTRYAAEKVDEMMENYDRYAAGLEESRGRLRAAAEKNVELLRKLLDECR